MNMLNVFMPANSMSFFETISDLADFNFIPIRPILLRVFPFLASFEESYKALSEHEVFKRLGAVIVAAIAMTLAWILF